jgi:hypothetical protein
MAPSFMSVTEWVEPSIEERRVAACVSVWWPKAILSVIIRRWCFISGSVDFGAEEPRSLKDAWRSFVDVAQGAISTTRSYRKGQCKLRRMQTENPEFAEEMEYIDELAQVYDLEAQFLDALPTVKPLASVFVMEVANWLLTEGVFEGDRAMLDVLVPDQLAHICEDDWPQYWEDDEFDNDEWTEYRPGIPSEVETDLDDDELREEARELMDEEEALNTGIPALMPVSRVLVLATC